MKRLPLNGLVMMLSIIDLKLNSTCEYYVIPLEFYTLERDLLELYFHLEPIEYFHLEIT